jgi:hypothetical protein
LHNSVLLGFEEIEYHQPRPLSETYQVPPAARGLMDNYQVPPTARPYFPSEYEIGYMEMHPPGQSVDYVGFLEIHFITGAGGGGELFRLCRNIFL